MDKNIFNFAIKTIVLLAVIFVLHLFILHSLKRPLFEDQIVLSYIINTLLATIIYTILYKMKDKFKTQIGFLFMGGSFLKFILFFILFYPKYSADNNISKMEFTSFFVPYAITLILETRSISKWLNRMK